MIIPLEDVTGSPDSSSDVYLPARSTKPFAPFRTLQDFEFTETAVTNLLPPKSVNKMLDKIHNSWSRGGSTLTIRNHQEMERSLKAAREYAVPASAS